MVNTDRLRGLFAERRLSQADVAEHLGISTRTLTTRMKTGVFGTDEIEKICELLDLSNPGDIFFIKKVT